jgi:hypothetical protein
MLSQLCLVVAFVLMESCLQEVESDTDDQGVESWLCFGDHGTAAVLSAVLSGNSHQPPPAVYKQAAMIWAAYGCQSQSG